MENKGYYAAFCSLSGGGESDSDPILFSNREAVFVPFRIHEQRGCAPAVVQALQVRRDDPDGEVHGLDRGGREEVQLVGERRRQHLGDDGDMQYVHK